MPVLLDATLAGWAAFELGLRVRESVHSKGGTAQDRATRILIAAAIGAAIAVALLTANRASSLRIPGPDRAAGLIVMWLGLVLRVWAVAALGQAFRTTVEVDPGQAIVTSGPYRWVRHPAYTGLLAIIAGLGLAAGNWLALVACVALPLAALLRRIHVEEAELTRVLGQPYRDYRARTKAPHPGRVVTELRQARGGVHADASCRQQSAAEGSIGSRARRTVPVPDRLSMSNVPLIAAMRSRSP